MNVCLLMIGDGRDAVHERANRSLRAVAGPFAREVVIDDREHELGFAGAIQAGWDRVLEAGCDWVFHFEADFIFARAVPLPAMVDVLIRHPYLVQMALKRQPVNAAEAEAGGIVELDPDGYHQRTHNGRVWTEHRKFFTTNPSIYSAALCELGWPQADESEGKFGIRLFEDQMATAAFWGTKFSSPYVEHIGDRSGTGY